MVYWLLRENWCMLGAPVDVEYRGDVLFGAQVMAIHSLLLIILRGSALVNLGAMWLFFLDKHTTFALKVWIIMDSTTINGQNRLDASHMWLNRWHWIRSPVVISHWLSTFMVACALSTRTIFHILHVNSAVASTTVTSMAWPIISFHCVGFKKFYRDLLVKTALFLWLLRLRRSDRVGLTWFPWLLCLNRILVSYSSSLFLIWFDPFRLLKPFEWFSVKHFFLITHRHNSRVSIARGRFPALSSRTFTLFSLEAIFIHWLLLCAIFMGNVSIRIEIVLWCPSLRWDSQSWHAFPWNTMVVSAITWDNSRSCLVLTGLKPTI